MKTKLRDGEQLVRKFDGIICKTGQESEAICYLTDRRLVFEELDREVKPEVGINWKKLVKRSLIGGVLGGGLGGGLGGASSVEVKPGSKIEGAVSIFWFDQLTRLELSEMKIDATFQKEKGQTEQVVFNIKKTSEQLTKEDQGRLKVLVKTAKEKAKCQKERELSINEKISLLTERNIKKGYINPELKLDSDISEKMKSGKTREQAIEELHKEEPSSA